MAEAAFASALGRLRAQLVAMKQSEIWTQIVEPRDQVYARFRPIFDPAFVPQLSPEEFRPFLYFEHNRHWTGLHRQVNRLTSDMPNLRHVLSVLLDQSRPVAQRLDEVEGAIKGLGRGIITASGGVGGLFDTCHDDTQRVLAEPTASGC